MSDPREPQPHELSVGEAIRRRRSVRRFDRDREVPESLVLAAIDAARFAPSSCNLQTWDFVWVKDEARRRLLAEETKSVLIAPVAIFVVYDRELAREGHANVQSASAAIMTLLLQATALGLASLWVNALGDRDRVRELLGVPDDYEALALVCLGWPADGELVAPERRPLDEVLHRDRYAGTGGLPKSPDPGDWTVDGLALYFKRKLQSGTRYNKPVAAFCDPVLAAVDRMLGPGVRRLLDVLPGTAMFTEALHRRHPDAALGAMEISAENHFFADRRAGGKVELAVFPREREAVVLQSCAPEGVKVPLARESGGLVVMPRVLPHPRLASEPFDAATILFRLEGIPRELRVPLLREVAARLAPEGRIVLAYVSARSWHLPAYALRRRMGRDSVEYAPVPEPNLIGPFEALAPSEVARCLKEAGLRIVARTALFPLPDMAAIAKRTAKAGGVVRFLVRVASAAAWLLRPLTPLLSPFAQIRITCLKRA